MSKAIENLNAAVERAAAIRLKVGVFRISPRVCDAPSCENVWSLPACQSLFLSSFGPIVMQGPPLATGTVDLPTFDQEALITALRIDQAGESTFPDFLVPTWRAGVVRYEVDFDARTVAYLGCNGEDYVEAYAAVEIS